MPAPGLNDGRRKREKAAPSEPFALAGASWRFLHERTDQSEPRNPIITNLGQAYLERDAQLWYQQQSGATLTAQQILAYHTQQQRRADEVSERTITAVQCEESGRDTETGADADNDKVSLSLPSFPSHAPNRSLFDLTLSPSSRALIGAIGIDDAGRTRDSSQAAPPVLELADTVIVIDTSTDASTEGGPKKKHGLIAADLLQHYAQKDLIDEERERTRKRERSRWERDDSDEPRRRDTGGVMVGGIGLDSIEATQRDLHSRPSLDSVSEEKTDTAGSTDSGSGSLDDSDMPDISDFIRHYEQADEPSFPTIVWRVKERLTQAIDIPLTVADELHTIQMQRRHQAILQHARRPSVFPWIHPPPASLPRTASLRFNLGAGSVADYEMVDDSRAVSEKKHTRAVIQSLSNGATADGHTAAATAAHRQYGAWYLPIRHWATSNEEKTKIEEAEALADIQSFTHTHASEEQKETVTDTDGLNATDADAAGDGFHGAAWRDRVSTIRAQLPELFCSQSFKAFLVKHRERVPHYLQPVRMLDDSQSIEDSDAPTHTDATASNISFVDSGSVEAEDGVGDDDMKSYLREVRMRELSLAGAQAVKQKQTEMARKNQLRKQRQLDRERRGMSMIDTITGTDNDNDEDDELNQLEELFHLPDDPFIAAFKLATKQEASD